MCGITGWIEWNKNMTHYQSIVKSMTQTQCKRGPDDTNTWFSDHVLFGHTRLVVVDPEGGKQPMSRNIGDREFTIVYNGELYNTEDLRQELVKRGHVFKGHSDTEVLLTSYIEWGEECLRYLNGIFAFAIWNSRDQRLFLARDRLGVKPLFYSEKEGSLIFGSEIKALLAHPGMKAEVDKEGLQELFGLGPSRTPGHAIYKGIKELRPAHALVYDRNGLRTYRYWQVESRPHEQSLEETVEHLRTLIRDAIERQLVADVKVCTFLSGGIDSSAITAIAANAFRQGNKGSLQTYSIDYVDNEKFFKASDYQPNSDSMYIEKVTSFVGSQHQNHIITIEQLVDHLTEAVHVRDLPGMADIDSSLLWFCKVIKQENTVALSGECADEIFGGYPWFHKKELYERNSFPWMTSIQERESLLKPEWREALKLADYVQQRYEETIREVPRLTGENPLDARRRELFYLNLTWFMTTLLERKDRMSMGASLEVRVPFADHRLVEYVWNIPWEMKTVDNLEKGILRRALRGLLPEEVLYRKKSPYPKTHHPLYTNAVREWMSTILDDPSSPILELIDRNRVMEIVETDGRSFTVPWFGQLMTGPQLVAHLIQINTWLKDYKVSLV